MYKVKNEAIQKLLEDIGRTLKRLMPPGWGFTLMLFDFSEDPSNLGALFYISSANREDVLATMKQFIAEEEGRNIAQKSDKTQ